MSNVVELRQYTLKSGQRDALIELFEREFIESQEVLRMQIPGTFRDADDADRFVWLRGFPDMEKRTKALAAFYGGSVWKAHRETANATMLDSDNVLLLRPAWNCSGFETETPVPSDVSAAHGHVIVAVVCYFASPPPDTVVDAFRRELPRVFDGRSGKRFVAAFVTEHGANGFPALPVREDENVFVWFAAAPDLDAARRMPLAIQLERGLIRPPEILRLLPTRRSRLRA
jgi:hypothetical protein